MPLSGVGAPTVGHEMLGNEGEVLAIGAEVERLMGRPVGAVMSSEIGGSNGVEPVAWASTLGVPLVDADGMGRAFPEVQMVSMNVAGLPVNYIVLSDVVGNVATLRPIDGKWSERHARALCVASGSRSLMADYILEAAQARGAVIEGSVSRALSIGRCVEDATDPVAALVDTLAPSAWSPARSSTSSASPVVASCAARSSSRDSARTAAASCGSRSRTRTSSPSRTARCWPACPT